MEKTGCNEGMMWDVLHCMSWDGCKWVSNNYNTASETEIGDANTRQSCIAMVLRDCPNATIASMQDPPAACRCQYGTDMREDRTTSYKACLLSSISATEGPTQAPHEGGPDDNWFTRSGWLAAAGPAAFQLSPPTVRLLISISTA